jgi:hypothetical protein
MRSKVAILLILGVAQAAGGALVGTRWTLADPYLALVVILSFFHALKARAYLPFVLGAGLMRDGAGLDVFGVATLTYLAVALLVSFIARFLNRDQTLVILPIVFISVFVVLAVGAVLRSFFGVPWNAALGVVFGRGFVLASGTTLITLPLLTWVRRCDWVPSGSSY